MDWMACSLEIILGEQLYTVLALPLNNIANMTLSSSKQVLTKVKYNCPIWFGLLHPHSLLDTKGVLTSLGVGHSTKVPGIDSTCWELIWSEFSDIF